MSAVEYLESAEAVADLAEHLARADHEQRHPEDGWYGRGGGWRYRRNEGAWTAVRFGGGPTVYYRPSSPGGYIPDFLPAVRYNVSDLGEAVHVWRLRSGMVSPDIGSGAALIAAALPEGVSFSDGVLYDRVPAADLPRAICAVMLAVGRVAALEVGR